MSHQTYQHLTESLPFMEGQKALLGFGFYFTVYFEDGHLPWRRQAAVDVFDDYWSMCGTNLSWMTNPTDHSWQKLDPSLSPHEWLVEQAQAKQVWDFCYHGGRTFDACSAFRIQGYGIPASTGKLSFLSAGFPVTWFAQHEEQHAVAVVKRWCDAIEPLHGSAGLAILASLDTQQEARTAAHVRALASRFPGLEVDYPAHHCLLLHNGIKSVNWLNILDQRWLSKLNMPNLNAPTPRLGDAEALRSKLDADLAAVDYRKGVILQAGPHPQTGDTNRRLDVDPYRRLAALLKPIQAHYGAPLLGFDAASTQAWLKRFD